MSELKKITNWGLHPVKTVSWIEPADQRDLFQSLNFTGSAIARGLGRSYGDSALSDTVFSTLRLNKFLEFDTVSGLLTCESGVSFEEILDVIVPAGWFLPVTPGTKFITVGGAIASDVHGKNHHASGSFTDHVLRFDLLLADGSVVTCSPADHPSLFEATRGGMGLTGIILKATFRLHKIETAFIHQTTIKAKNLETVMAAFDEYAGKPFSVAWIDCLSRGKNLGRSVLTVGDFAKTEQLTPKLKNNPVKPPKGMKLGIPFLFPEFVLNKLTVKLFNHLFYTKAPNSVSDAIISYEPFFYPLDAILNWNRIYGKSGFTQYQFVLPPETSYSGLVDILETISKKGSGSFLAVLKQFGEQNNMISFPRKGYTLALDFPIRPGLFEFLDELDTLVLKYGGRFYLTKDVRLKKRMMEAGYPRLEEWHSIVKSVNPDLKWCSEQYRRIFLA